MSASVTVRASDSYAAPISCSSYVSPCLAMVSSLSQVCPADFGVVGQVARRALEHDAARLEHVAAAGDGQGHRGILLDEQDGHALLVDGQDRLEDLLDKDRRQSHGGLVEQQEPGAGHERAADGKHLLLAAGERARDLVAPLLEPA